MAHRRHPLLGPHQWRRAVAAVVRFELRAVVITLLACAVVFGTSPIAAPAVSAAEPKVVIIVGPVGGLTDSYRADGNRAARAARSAGAVVEKIYSPDATWPRVRDALQGASLVVYLGHGNGWPSRYRDAPWPKTQDGLGLNPVAGSGDGAHQYFGESYLASDVRLAPHAVVLLNHLCYASGNSEPGLPEGGLETGKQRVDNYAAGWLAAGAEAVIAEGHGGPAYYVEQLLAGAGTVDAIWRRAPTAHGHVLAFSSVRTPGMTALMDPTHRSSGFYRSLVGKVELRADEIARGAASLQPDARATAREQGPHPGPSITGVAVAGVPTVDSSLRVTLKLDKNAPKPSKDLGIGVRWDPIVLDPPPVLPAVPARESSSPVAPQGPDSSSVPDASSLPDAASVPVGEPLPTAGAPATEVASIAPAPPPDQQPDSQPSPAATPEPEQSTDAPEVVLISPEVPGSVVQVDEVKVGKSAITADLVTPAEPGLYRLALSLHDRDGVAFDLPRRDPIPDFTVRVTGSLSAAVSASGRRTVVAGSMFSLPVAVANTGSLAWGTDPSSEPAGSRPAAPAPGEGYSQVVGRWMRLGGPDGDAASPSARAMVQPSPGETGSATLTFQAPAQPGTYLLVLDVVSQLYGSLTAVGGEPMTVRVLVTIAPGAASAGPAATADQGGSAAAAR